MEMPKPGAAHKQLEVFAGTWRGEEKMHPSPWDPKGGVATASLVSRVACDGFYVVGDYEQRRDGVVSFRGHSVFGYDAPSQEVVLYWFDSTGMGVDVFRGKLEGQTLKLTCHNAMGHHRLVYDFRERDTLRSKMDTSADGKQWQTMFEGAYHHS
ncbi:MAG: DUF1579 family protein [Planctomycetota bacterium]